MGKAKINMDADLRPSKFKNLLKTSIVFPEWLSGKNPDKNTAPCLLIVHK